eukprot:12110244-Alexandrium_andersonii.AAC.1
MLGRGPLGALACLRCVPCDFGRSPSCCTELGLVVARPRAGSLIEPLASCSGFVALQGPCIATLVLVPLGTRH